jgi:hypothetical protein
MNKNLLAQKMAVQAEVEKIKNHILQNELLSPDGKSNFTNKVRSSLPSYLAPGNVGDVNKVIWPFFFRTSPTGVIAPNRAVRTQISVTQEAAFVWTGFSKVVYNYNTVTGVMTYIDPEDNLSTGLAQGLRVSVRDASSSREFFGQAVDLDQLGNPIWPTKLDAPMIVMPNANLEAVFSNSNATTSYVCSLVLFGYRVRIENAQSLLSTIYG